MYTYDETLQVVVSAVPMWGKHTTFYDHGVVYVFYLAQQAVAGIPYRLSNEIVCMYNVYFV